MLADAIGKMLPATAAIALTPIQIIALVVILGGAQARASGPAFLAGWLAALTLASGLALLLVDRLDDSRSTPLVHWLRLGLGLLLLWGALRLWRTRPQGDTVPEPPAWMASLGDARPGRAFVLGGAVCLTNPKILALVFAGMSSLAYLALAPAAAAWALVAFVALASLPVIGLLALHALGGARGAASIAALKDFMLRNNNVILMVVLALLGVGVFGSGLSGIAAWPG